MSDPYESTRQRIQDREERVRAWEEFFRREEWSEDAVRRMKHTASYHRWSPQEWLKAVREAR